MSLLMSQSSTPILSQVLHVIKQVVRKKTSGELQLQRGDRRWSITFQYGQPIYATDNYHRVRRWQRMLRQHEVQYVPQKVFSSDLKHWERTWIEMGVAVGDITVSTAHAMLERSLWEVLLVGAGHQDVTLRWRGANPEEVPALTRPDLCLPLRRLEPLAKEVHKLHHRLQSLGIPVDYLDEAPVFQQGQLAMNPGEFGATTYLGLVPLLNGRRTMLDVMVTMRQPLEIVAHIIRHLMRQDAVEFRPLEDRPLTTLPPFAPRTQAASMASTTTQKYPADEKKVPLIACVDDSPQVCAVMTAIIEKAGYRCIATQDSVRAVSLLLQHQPDLIFLDLIMPIVNGYEVCKQLRRVKRFKTVPVVILTGNDGAIDRVRAKVVGASDFVPKPVRPNKIVALLQKYFMPRKTSSQRFGKGRSPVINGVQRSGPAAALNLRSPMLNLN